MRLCDKDVYDYLHMCISIVLFKKMGPPGAEIEVLRAMPDENGDVKVDYCYKGMRGFPSQCLVTKEGFVKIYSKSIETLENTVIYSGDSDCGNIFEWLENEKHLKLHFDDEDTFVI